jgi:spore germination protein GerM
MNMKFNHKIKAVTVILLSLFLMTSLFTGCTQKSANADSASTKSLTTVSPEVGDIDRSVEATTTATTVSGNVKKVTMKLYFPGIEGITVLNEQREVEVKDGAVIKAAVAALIEGPKDTKKMRVSLPSDTRLLGAKVVNKIVTLDFSQEFTKPNDTAEILEKVSLVNTLTEIPGIEKVHILIEGKEWVGPSGMPYGDMIYTKLTEKGEPFPAETKTITLYFGNANADKVVAEKRDVTYEKGRKIEAVIFEELAKGPVTKGLGNVIPKDAKVLSVENKNGVCNLNLSKEFIDNCHTGSAGESMIINSIVNSITEIPGNKSVQFLIEGQKRKAFVHMVFDKPISRNTSIIQK